jgi:hypothetical protein
MTTKAITPLRQRMIEDMNARKLCAGTQKGHSLRGGVGHQHAPRGVLIFGAWRQQRQAPPDRDVAAVGQWARTKRSSHPPHG